MTGGSLRVQVADQPTAAPILVRLVEPDLDRRLIYRAVGAFIARGITGFAFGVGFWLAAAWR